MGARNGSENIFGGKPIESESRTDAELPWEDSAMSSDLTELGQGGCGADVGKQGAMKPAGRARGRNDMDRYVLGDEPRSSRPLQFGKT
jgi:hypothetical protein